MDDDGQLTALTTSELRSDSTRLCDAQTTPGPAIASAQLTSQGGRTKRRLPIREDESKRWAASMSLSSARLGRRVEEIPNPVGPAAREIHWRFSVDIRRSQAISCPSLNRKLDT